MPEKLTISEMACYPEGTVKRKEKCYTLRPTTGTSYSCSLMVLAYDCCELVAVKVDPATREPASAAKPNYSQCTPSSK